MQIHCLPLSQSTIIILSVRLQSLIADEEKKRIYVYGIFQYIYKISQSRANEALTRYKNRRREICVFLFSSARTRLSIVRSEASKVVFKSKINIFVSPLPFLCPSLFLRVFARRVA